MRRATVMLGGVLALWGWTMPALSLTPAETYAGVAPSVWRVAVFDPNDKPLASGSALVLAPEVMVTACHVVDKARRIQVQSESTTLDAKLDLRDAERDLCQLKVPGLVAPALVVRESAVVKVGQTVYAIGNSAAQDLMLSSGLVSALRRDARGSVQLILTSASIPGGPAGGGLFDESGALLGVATSAGAGDAQGLNVAIPAGAIKAMWSQHGRAYPMAHTPAAKRDAPVGMADPSAPVALRPGDEWEYSILDKFTGSRRSAVYRVDRVQGGEAVFSGGVRTENLDGRVLRIGSPIGGDMDSLSPPGGWLTRDLWLRARWNVKFEGNDPQFQRSLDLQGVVQGNQKLVTPAGEFDVVHVVYSGWASRFMVSASIMQKVEVSVWYAPALRRVVRFESDVRPSTNGLYLHTASREIAELTRIRRQ